MGAKDKQKVIGEALDETQVARFLAMQPSPGEDADFHILTKAYRGLPVDYFDQFLGLFKAQGRNINATDREGRTLLQIVAAHKRQPGYVEVLKKHGAQ
ncbi:MAG: PA4642 family protein [Pseudomonadota bacterium]|nr:PA4642 family protein [Pseudomonadota bacterium]